MDRVICTADINALSDYPFFTSSFKVLFPHTAKPPMWEHSDAFPKTAPKNEIGMFLRALARHFGKIEKLIYSKNPYSKRI